MATLRLPCSTMAPVTCLLARPRRDMGGPVGLPRTRRGPRALLGPCKAPKLLLLASLPDKRLAARELAQLLSGVCPPGPLAAKLPAGRLTLGLGLWRFAGSATGAHADGASWETYSCPTCTQAAREHGARVGRCERRGPVAESRDVPASRQTNARGDWAATPNLPLRKLCCRRAIEVSMHDQREVPRGSSKDMQMHTTCLPADCRVVHSAVVI